MKLDAAAIHQKFQAKFGDKVASFEAGVAQPFAVIAGEAIADVAAFAKSDPELSFENLMNLSAVDYPKEAPPRIEVVYHLFSYKHGHRFVLKVRLPRDEPRVPTVEKVWGVANWHEREAFDMMGVTFEGHGDLRRILLPDDWEGFPLRKDWKDPDFYNGLHVKPTQQMAERFMAGEKIGIGPFDFTPFNAHAGQGE